MKRNKVISYLSKLSHKELSVLNEEAKRKTLSDKQKEAVKIASKIIDDCLTFSKEYYSDDNGKKHNLSYEEPQNCKTFSLGDVKDIKKIPFVDYLRTVNNAEARVNELTAENEKLKMDLDYERLLHKSASQLHKEACSDLELQKSLNETLQARINNHNTESIERYNARDVVPLDNKDIHDLSCKIHGLDKDYSITFRFERKQFLLAEYFKVEYKGEEIYKTKENSIKGSAKVHGFLTGLYEQLKQSK